MFVDKKKVGALVDQHAKKKMPPMNPGENKDAEVEKDASDEHIQEEADHEDEDFDDEKAEHEAGDLKIAQEQASRVSNGNEDADLAAMASEIDDESDETPAFVLDEDVWARSKKAVAGLSEEPEDSVLVILHTYDALGGKFEGDDEAADDSNSDQEDANA